MDFEQLQTQLFKLLGNGQLAQGEAFLLEHQSAFQGRALGRWYYLLAGTLRRSRPDDHAAFREACTQASRLLQGDHEGLCGLYLTQSSDAMVQGDWHTARTYIRRMRALIARYPEKYGIQRLKGSVLINEGLIERAAGNFSRAVALLRDGIESMEKILHPVDPKTRRSIIALASLDIADSYLRMSRHGEALRVFSTVDLAVIPQKEKGRYYYVQSRYWLALGMVRQAKEWFEGAEGTPSWDPDWSSLLLEVKAGIARAENRPDAARALLEEAMIHAAKCRNQVFVHLLRREMKHLTMEGEQYDQVHEDQTTMVRAADSRTHTWQ